MPLLDRKYQATVPRKIQAYLGLSPGDCIEFIITNAGGVLLKKSSKRDSARVKKKPVFKILK